MNDQILLLEVEVFNIIKEREFEEDEIAALHQKIIDLNNPGLKLLLANIYDKWAEHLTRYLDEDSEDLDQEFEMAFEKINQAIELRPSYYKYYFNWGRIIQDYAELKRGETKKKYFLQAIEIFKKASDLCDHYAGAFFQWGYCLLAIGLMEKESKVEFLEEAIELLEKSLYLDFGHVKTYNNLAMAHSVLGEHKPNEIDHYHNKAIHYFSLSVKARSYDNSAYDDWAVILKEKALMEDDESQKEFFFSEAISKHLEGVSNGSDTYNLACTYAVMGDKFNALFYLRKAVEANEDSINEAMSDADWDPYRELPKFKEIISREGDNLEL